MNQRNKKMTKEIIQRKRLNRINPLKGDGKQKQKVPDFSGKYHGKLNDKNVSTHVNMKKLTR